MLIDCKLLIPYQILPRKKNQAILTSTVFLYYLQMPELEPLKNIFFYILLIILFSLFHSYSNNKKKNINILLKVTSVKEVIY